MLTVAPGLFTTRVLPPEEWGRLQETEAGTVSHLFDPQTTDVLVVERDGEIVGTWTLLPIWHLECAWIHPNHRGKGSVARRLWSSMRRMLRQRHIGSVLTSAVSDDIRALITEHLHGTPVPGEMFLLPLGDPPCPPLSSPR